uniref:Uncharacterized protein n=1 Tax=Timema shepardi TaxID=629360 RepID=A0A7R9G622_TIMSH|nr:unnamed protein product [Timema shepardi]
MGAQLIQLKTLNAAEPLGAGICGISPQDCYGAIERVWPWSGLVSFPLGGRIEQAYFHRESVLIDNREISPSLNLMDILRGGMSASLRVIPSHTGTDIRFIAVWNTNEDHQNKAEDLPRPTALPCKESNETIKVVTFEQEQQRITTLQNFIENVILPIWKDHIWQDIPRSGANLAFPDLANSISVPDLPFFHMGPIFVKYDNPFVLMFKNHTV